MASRRNKLFPAILRILQVITHFKPPLSKPLALFTLLFCCLLRLLWPDCPICLLWPDCPICLFWPDRLLPTFFWLHLFD